MTGDSKEAWAEVDRRFSEFGRIVADRYRKAGDGRTPDETQEMRRSLEDAFSKVTRRLDQAFSSVGDTIRDPEAKESFKQAGKAVLTAFGATANEVGDQVRKRRPPKEDRPDPGGSAEG